MRNRGHPHVGPVTAAVALGGLAGHGAFVFGGSFAWVALWLLGAGLCPLLICVVTPRHRLLNAVLANLAMLIIPTLERLVLGRVWPLPPDPEPPAVAVSEVLTLTALSVISVLLALAVVGAFDSHREG
jgi:hypothetical protein